MFQGSREMDQTASKNNENYFNIFLSLSSLFGQQFILKTYDTTCKHFVYFNEFVTMNVMQICNRCDLCNKNYI